MAGVIAHVANPTPADAERLAREAEDGGASWIGFADAFWWRDVWMLLTAVAGTTSRIEVGPAMTNPYMRHPFHTASALATLHELAPGRVFCGIAAGGSEVSAAGHISRRDAPERATALVELLRSVSTGEPLDPESGRTLALRLPPTPILMAGRGDRMLAAVGARADRALLWAIPVSDLQRSVGIIRQGATKAGRSPRLTWAPLVRHPGVTPAMLGHPAVYAALNTAPAVRVGWGLDERTVDAIRAALVLGHLDEAIAMVPDAAMDELVIEPTATDLIVARARALGVTQLAVPGFGIDSVGSHLAWAADIEARL